MFRRKTRNTPGPRAVTPADPEVGRLQAEIGAKQREAAELESDLVESQESLAAFEREFEARVGIYARRLTELRAQVESAHRAAFRRMWESRPHAPPYVDVAEQFRRAWQHTPTGEPPRPPRDVPAEVEAQIKILYRDLARRYHPDLAPDEAEREWRTPRMAAVNVAYAARDLTTLQALAMAQDDVSLPAPRFDTRAALIASLQRESARLEELIARLEKELDSLTNSPALQLQLDAKLARRAGRDLLGEIAGEIQREIEYLESELRRS